MTLEQSTRRTDTLTQSALWMAAALAFVAVGTFLLSDALEWDAAEQALHSQFFSLGYGPQPPLYDWLIHGLFLVTGPSFAVLLGVKAMLLWVIFWCSGLFFKALTGCGRLATAGAFAVFLPAQMMWEAQRNLSHTVLATTFAALFFAISAKVLVSSAQRISWTTFALIGVVISGGLLSKYNMLAVFLFTLVALLLVPEFRRRILSPSLALAALIPTVVCLPHALWAIRHMPEIVQAMEGKLKTGNSAASGPGELSVLTGLQEWVLGVVGYGAIPMVVFLGLWMYEWFLRAKMGGNAKPVTNLMDHAHLIGMSAVTKVSGYYIALFTGLCFFMIIFGHVTQFRDRWFTPFFFLIPGFIVFWLARRPQLIAGFIRVCKTVVAIASIGLVARIPVSGLLGQPGVLNVPANEIAAHVAATTPAGTLIALQDIRLAGALRMHLPNYTVLLTPPFTAHSVPSACAILVITSAGKVLPADAHSHSNWSWSGHLRYSRVTYAVAGNFYKIGDNGLCR